MENINLRVKLFFYKIIYIHHNTTPSYMMINDVLFVLKTIIIVMLFVVFVYEIFILLQHIMMFLLPYLQERNIPSA